MRASVVCAGLLTGLVSVCVAAGRVAAQDAPDGGGSVVEVEVLGADGRAAEGATLRLVRRSGAAESVDAASGRAQVRRAPGDPVTWCRAETGVAPPRAVTAIEPAAAWRHPTVSLRLVPADSIVGRVVDDASGTPIQGARVRLAAPEWLRGFYRDGWITDAAGAFGPVVATGLATTTFEVSADGHVPATATVRWSRESEARPRIALHGLATLQAIVRAPDGTPVPGAKVVLVPAYAPGPESAQVHDLWEAGFPLRIENPRGTTGDDGSCRMEGIDAGRWARPRPAEPAAGQSRHAVLASAPGYAPSLPTAFDFAGAPPAARVDVVLRRPATLDVVVRDPHDAPIPDARVVRGVFPSGLQADWRIERGLVTLFATLGPDATPGPGEARFTGLAPRRHAVEVRADGFVPAWRIWTIEERSVRREFVELTPAVPVRVRVLDDRSHPVAGAGVVVDTDDATRESLPRGLILEAVRGRTDADGTFVASAAGPWPVTVRIELPDGVAPGTGWSPSFAVTDRRPDAPPTELRVVRLGTARLRLVVPAGASLPADVVVRTSPLSRSLVIAGPEIVVRGAVPGPGATVLCAAGWVPVEIGSRMKPGEEVDLGDVVLDPGVTLRGRVVGPDGVPVAGAFVRVVQRDSAVDPNARTGEDGTFGVAHASAGENDILVIAPGGARATFRARGDRPAEFVVPAAN